MSEDKNVVCLRGFVYFEKKDNRFYACCIDLNLTDQGKTLDEVLNKLHENMLQYITSELEYYKKNNIQGFPFRKAPMNVKIFYYRAVLASHIANSYNRLKGLFNTDTNSLELCPA